MRAGFSALTCTRRSRLMRPLLTPSERSTGRNISTRENPVRQSQMTGSYMDSKSEGSQPTTWSEPTTSTIPSASACQSASALGLARAGAR